MVDPSVMMGGISMPGSEERYYLMLSHHWFIIFDNIDWVQRWQSDALCRTCTGQATSMRALWTNEDEIIFKYKICVGLNGINNAATKPDLLNRAIFLNLDPIKVRIPEGELWGGFNAAKPEILGGIFDALSKAISIHPNIRIDNLPRMADFAVWGCAIAEALGRTKEEFLEAYRENIGRVNRAALEASPVAMAIMAMMEGRLEWSGTADQLFNELKMFTEALFIDTKSQAWVKSPDALGKRMRTVIPNLRSAGIGVERKKSGERLYRIFFFSSLKEVSNVSNVSTDSEKPDYAKCPTCPTCPTDPGAQVSKCPTCPESGHLRSDKNHQQANRLGTSDGLDTLAPTLRGGSEVMQFIADHVKKYDGESPRAFSVISAKLEDQKCDPELINDCITRYKQGHRMFIPMEVKA